MASESKSSRQKDQDETEWPSGSEWGRAQLDRLNFRSEPRTFSFDALQSQFESLPPFLSSAIERDVGSDPEKRNPVYERFFSALDDLSLERQESTPNHPRTRSAAAQIHTFQSSPLNFKQPVASSPSASTAAQVHALTSSPPSFKQSAASSPSNARSRGSPLRVKRRKSDSEGQESPVQTLSTHTHQPEVADLEGAQSTDGNSPTNHPPFPPSSTIHDVHFSSSPTDSTYMASSPALAAANYRDQDQDQVEQQTNYMMQLLLSAICISLTPCSEDSGHANSTIRYRCNYGTPLKIPIDGHIVNTTPDLKISVSTNEKTVVILDYEGKRLKPSMTPEAKFAQQVCHLIGRAQHNQAGDVVADDRKIYLLTTQHAAVSVLSCRLKHRWLRQMNSDVTVLGELDQPVEVHEYGPADLNDPADRVRCVATLTALLIFLFRRTNLFKEGGTDDS